MKKIFLWSIVIFLSALFASCTDEPTFPDPGFDLLTDKNFVVRRDTADSFVIRLNVKAPAGINVIQILDGRTYDVIEELAEYKGQTDFLFKYSLDFSGIDKQRDSVLIYNVRILTHDNRAFNSSFKINLKKLSVPEIVLPNNDIIGTTVPVVGIRGLVSTGIYKIRSIKVYVNGVENYTVPAAEIDGVSEYRLETNIYYPFEVGQEDLLKIEIEDEKGQKKEVSLTVKGIKMKRVKSILATEDNKPYGLYNIEYDSQGRISKLISTIAPSFSYTFSFVYDQNGRVTRCEYRHHEHLTFKVVGSIDFTYENGKLIKGVHGLDGVPNEIFQNIVYRPDGTIRSYDVGITTIQDVQYADGFAAGEKVFAENWGGHMLGSMARGARQVKIGFVPVLNPLYMEGMPQIWNAKWFGYEFSTLCYYKYVYTNDARGPGNTEAANKYFQEYTYTCDETGQLETLTWKRNKTTGWRTFRYVYDED